MKGEEDGKKRNNKRNDSMKKLISILILFSLSLTFIVIATPAQQQNYIDIEVPLGEVIFYTIPDDKEFDRIEVLNCKQQFQTAEKPETIFRTESSEKPSTFTSMIYEHPYEHEILRKGDRNVLRLYAPGTHYESGRRIDTEEMVARVYFEPKCELKGFTTSYEPQNPDFEYVIITNESLWQTFNDEFKSWKISTDSKINNIWIVNVSDILGWRAYTVNDTYGDATNASCGNTWIPNDKQVTSSYSLFNDTQAQIRNFLRDCYNTENTRYVLLGGNKDMVPSRQVATRASGDGCGTYSNDMSHASDMYYSCLHYCMNNNTNSYWMESECCGNEFDEVDWGFDLYVGRALVNNVSTLNNWIGKTKNYTSGVYNGNYLEGQICAGKNGAGSITNNTWLDLGGEYAASIHRQSYPISNMTWVNEQNISQAQWNIMDDYVNGDVSGWNGIHMIFCSGHGDFHSGTLWDQYHPWICFNGDAPNFIYTESCKSGGFGTTTVTCIEDWMKYNSCIFAGVANSAFGWFGASTFFIEELLSEMFNQTVGNQTLQFSKAHQDARELQGHSSYDGVWAMIYKETNFFGDPALEYQWYVQGDIGPEFITIDGGINMTNVYTSTPTFKWTRITNATQYQLQISNNFIFTDLVISLLDINEYTYPAYYSQDTTNVSFTLPPSYPLPTFNKLYYCRVRAYTEA